MSFRWMLNLNFHILDSIPNRCKHGKWDFWAWRATHYRINTTEPSKNDVGCTNGRRRRHVSRLSTLNSLWLRAKTIISTVTLCPSACYLHFIRKTQSGLSSKRADICEGSVSPGWPTFSLRFRTWPYRLNTQWLSASTHSSLSKLTLLGTQAECWLYFQTHLSDFWFTSDKTYWLPSFHTKHHRFLDARNINDN